MPSDSDQSALVVLVPAAEPLVGGFRKRFDPSAALGMPAHVTVLYPFVHPAELGADVIDVLRELFAEHARFSFALTGVCGFPEAVYLHPEPLAPFDALTRHVFERFPQHAPYRGQFVDPLPHLTLGQQPASVALKLSTDCIDAVGPALPLRCEASEARLAIRLDGRWELGTRFPFKAQSADSPKLTLRRAQSSDGAIIGDIYLRSIRWALPRLRLAHGEAEVRHYFATEIVDNRETFVAERAGSVIGFITLRPGWIEHLYVDPNHVGQGVGSQLIAIAMQRLTATDSLCLYAFQANHRARRFYEARGFYPVDFNDGDRNEENEPDVFYRLMR